MMAVVGGWERAKTDFEKLFRDSGFALEDIMPSKSMFSIVVGRPVER